ncbi:hypothetical protein PG997_014244 [Apiospora hydei]|uniref:Uncharacterized protein n=1 Tax=Apiospora hydei TaxID=1337664 RepID=A0ABR1UT88_9PEZI
MLVTVSPYKILPPPQPSFRLCVEISFDLLRSLDPSVISFSDTASNSSVQRQARVIWDPFLKDISNQLGVDFHCVVTWPKPEVTEVGSVADYICYAYVFDYNVSEKPEPPFTSLWREFKMVVMWGFSSSRPVRRNALRRML